MLSGNRDGAVPRRRVLYRHGKVWEELIDPRRGMSSGSEERDQALPDVEILPRETAWNTQLHWIAIKELQSFAGIKDSILGLGSFYPPADESDC
jgi:hypothetical protein